MLNNSPTRRVADQLWIADWLSNALAWAMFLYLTVDRSADRLLWSDEILSAVLLRESFTKMLWGWWQGADGGGIFFYVSGWIWERVVGGSDLSLRLLSALPLCASFSVLWWVSRRYYRPLPVAVGSFVVYLGSDAVSWHFANGRFYGLFLLAFSLTLVMFVLAIEQRERPGRTLLLLSFAAHLLLSGTHILGALYSFAVILALYLCDRREARRRWSLYISCAAGWLIVPLSLPAILNSAKVGKQFFWTVPPTWEMFRAMVTLYSTIVDQALFTSVLLLAALWVIFGPHISKHEDVPKLTSQSTMLLVVCLYAAAFLVFLKSCFGISLAADRYILPIALAAVLLFADLLTRILNYRFFHMLRRWPVELFCIALIAVGMFSLARQTVPLAVIYPAKGYEGRLLSQIPVGSIVVVPYDLSVYPVALYYGARFHQRLVFPVDHIVTGPNTMGVNLAERWNAAGIYAGHQPDVEQIFDGHSSFYLLLSSSGDEWWNLRIKNNPHIFSTKVGIDNEFRALTIWKIDQR